MGIMYVIENMMGPHGVKVFLYVLLGRCFA